MATCSGQCLCGAVKFSAEVPERVHSACHCGMCRRWSGGAPFFGVRVAGVAFTPSDSLARYPSSAWAERGFCKACGSTLFYHLLPANLYVLSAGAFDESASFRIEREFFVDHKPDGYALAGDHPRWTEAETLKQLAPSA